MPIGAFIAQNNQPLVAHARRVCSEQFLGLSAPIGAFGAQNNQPSVALAWLGVGRRKERTAWFSAKLLAMAVGLVTFALADWRFTNARRIVDGKEVPLTRGKLQIISEWSELYYRTVELRPLKKIPEKYLR